MTELYGHREYITFTLRRGDRVKRKDRFGVMGSDSIQVIIQLEGNRLWEVVREISSSHSDSSSRRFSQVDDHEGRKDLPCAPVTAV